MLNSQRFGRFLLLKRISAGGMAEVYLAQVTGATGLKQVVALKRLLPWASEDSEFITMFLDETRISSRLSHANIARVTEFGEVNGQYFLAMEYIAGKDLRAIHTQLRQTGRGLPVPMALHLGARLCQALGYAHQMRAEDGSSMEIIHRDVSPPNVLVSYDGVVKLIDFGIAKAAARATRTRAGHLKGKIAYMSPEQVQGARLDQRSDLFSLGILLHESLTGRVLFQGDSQMATMHQVRRAEVPPPSAVAPEVPADVDRIVLKALARDRDQRYSSAAQMREDIQRHLVRTQTVFGTNHLADWIQAEFEQDLALERELRKQIRSLRPRDIPAPAEPAHEFPEDVEPTIQRPPTPTDETPAAPAGPFEAVATLESLLSNPGPVAGLDARPTEVMPDTTPVDLRAPEFSLLNRAPVEEATPTDEQLAVDPWIDPRDTLEQAPPAAPAPPPEYIGDGLDPQDDPGDDDGLVDDTRVTSYFQRSAEASPGPPAVDYSGAGAGSATRLVAASDRRRLSSTHIIIAAACLTLVLAGLLVLLFLGKQRGKLARKAARQRGAVVITTKPPAACSVALDTSIKRLLSPGESLSLSGVETGGHQVLVNCVGYQPFSTTIEVNAARVTQVEASLRKE